MHIDAEEWKLIYLLARQFSQAILRPYNLTKFSLAYGDDFSLYCRVEHAEHGSQDSETCLEQS
ncbi:hypothetical protein CXF96_12910 [Stenotrophomonas sp. Betaine-02u-21]|nr:hypothetical protein CXF96_12910 [Stenotrophomonas sp. Betaine-02u-21]PKH76606.1 hypothetical protein CXF90_00435 [Stenotrophomonas sp. Betaine-02u-23]PKH96004.1 hypothetical protein CXG43_09600 [Stenotrophomonas sp. Bg11-02]